MELLDTKTGLEEQGPKVNPEQHGKRGKMELLDTKNRPEEPGFVYLFTSVLLTWFVQHLALVVLARRRDNFMLIF